MKRVLIFGVDGMLGHRVWREFCAAEDLEVHGTIRGVTLPRIGDVFHVGDKLHPKIHSGIDVCSSQLVSAVIADVEPHFIINCVGILKQREAQADDQTLMIKVNALFPNLLRDYTKRIGGRLITFSSDCVFLGSKAGPYSEKDIPDAWSLYGRTKTLGEIQKDALTLRTSFIGFEVKGFMSLLEWFLNAVQKQKIDKKPIYGYTQAIWSGVSTAYLAEWLVSQVRSGKSLLDGLFQMTAKAINKFDLLTLINQEWNLGAEILPSNVFTADKICNREMDGSRFAATGTTIPSWNYLIHGLTKDFEFYRRIRSS